MGIGLGGVSFFDSGSYGHPEVESGGTYRFPPKLLSSRNTSDRVLYE